MKTGQRTKQDDKLASTGKRSLFALDTDFKERKAPRAAPKTPGKEENSGDIQGCMVKVRLKIFHGVGDVQEAVTGMMDHCLAILHKHNKKACFVNRKKTLEAYKATDFPRNFTDFYNDQGIWDKLFKSFLNTIPVDKSHSFTGLFYFRSEWEPGQLF
jgi:hypothetical protein